MQFKIVGDLSNWILLLLWTIKIREIKKDCKVTLKV